MDKATLATIIISGVGMFVSIAGLTHTFIKNFKEDMDARFDKMDKRMDNFEAKIISIEERMFWLATGKSLSQAILEEKMKDEK